MATGFGTLIQVGAHRLLLAILGALLTWTAPVAADTLLDNSPHQGIFVSASSPGQLLKVGQVLQVPSDDTALVSFTIWARRFQTSANLPPTFMRAAVFEWDLSTLKTVGPALYISPPVGPLNPGGPPIAPWTFDMGRTSLEEGAWYAIVAEGDSQTEWGTKHTGTPLDGYLVAQFGAIESTSGHPWFAPSPLRPQSFVQDMAYRAVFTAPAVPESSALLMVALAVVGVIARRSARWSAA